jgi:uncharacterized protein (DUF1810 family)
MIEEVKELVSALKGAVTEDSILEVLGSPAAQKVYAAMTKTTDKDNAVLFCKCPICGTAFETNLPK